MKLDFSYDESNDILTVEGLKFSGDLFRRFSSSLPLGQPFMLLGRDGGVITIFTFKDIDAMAETARKIGAEQGK